jgi:long-chain acyl-CoA synthetase
MSFNLSTMLREQALANPDKACLKFLGQRQTYSELDRLSGLVAGSLIELGLEPGDRVAVCLPNLPEFVATYFGILKAGMTMVPLNPLLKGPEIAYHLHDSGAKVLVAFELFTSEAEEGTADLDLSTFVVPFPGSEQPPPDGMLPFSDLMVEHPVDPVRGDIFPTDASDTAVMIYTSGTTGRPKGAELTHFQLYMNATVAGELFGCQPEDVALAVLPFFHVFGLSSVLNLTLRYGGAVSIVPRFEAPGVLDAIEQDGITVFLGVPTMFQAVMAEDRSKRNLSTLRVAVSGGASMPGEVMRQFEDEFGIIILEGYGLSETASTASFNQNEQERKQLSVGKPIWGVEMRIVDDEDRPLPPGEDNVGEIVMRGHNVMKRYHNRPEETADALRNGWFHTGDLAYVDEDGFYFIVDRKKDLIIRGGYNIYPREIEEVLYEHRAVAEAAVIGQPDERLGEEVVAVVVAKPGESPEAEEIVAFCKSRLAAYKYPRHVRFVDDLPKGPTGKVLKKDIKL